MAVYMYQLAYTPESIAAQIKNPQDRIESAARPLVEAIGGKILAGGFSFGDYDLVIVFEAPDDESVASLILAVVAGGAIKAGKTTKLISGSEWVNALKKASSLSETYRPAK